jgi:hypothetical protein
MNDELEKKWQETLMDYVKVLSQHLCGGSEGNFEN